MIQASAPGKLYITGEYAVLEPNHPAIIVAVDQFITITLTPKNDEGSITSSYSNFLPIPWTRKNGTIFVDERENPFNYVLQAIQTTETYVKEQGKSLHFYHLTIDSDLANKDGRKYGLGSSGAVTVATIKVILDFYQLPYDDMLIYKLSVLTHLAIGSNGSFGDIAASSFGGWIAYSTFDRQWLIEQMNKQLSMTELTQLTWKDLSITALPAPKALNLWIGWTGSPASTTHLVDQLHHEEQKEKDDHFQSSFLNQAKTIVNQTIEAFLNEDTEQILISIEEYRKLLQKLEKHHHLCIETEAIQTLCQIAKDCSGVGKSSGAGGGDCGIVFLPKTIDQTPMIQQWKQHHIKQLPFHIFYQS